MPFDLQSKSRDNLRRVLLIADYGRSGQGWLSYMLCYILNATFIEPYNALVGIKYSSNGKVLELTQGRLANRRSSEYILIVKTHAFPAVNFNLTDKVIYMTRDPRDVAVSEYCRNMVMYRQNKGPQQLRINNLKTLTAHRLRRLKVVSYCATAVRWKQHVRAWKGIPAHVVRYEDLSMNTAETLKGILKYLDTQAGDDLIAEAVREFSFEALTDRKKGEEDAENPEFRKGVVGDYSNHFNRLHLRIFRWICGDAGKSFGYSL